MNENNYKNDKCALFYIDKIMLSCTQQINHVTYLVAINKLYDATVTCFAQFPAKQISSNCVVFSI